MLQNHEIGASSGNPTWVQGPMGTWAIFCYFFQGTESKLKQPGLEPVATWDAGTIDMLYRCSDPVKDISERYRYIAETVCRARSGRVPACLALGHICAVIQFLKLHLFDHL